MSAVTFKRFSLYLVILAACFLAVDRVTAFALTRLLEESSFRFSRLYHGGSDAEAVILGNSRAVNAFYVPAIKKETGLSVLNLSYNGMSMPVVEALLMDYLERNSAPRLLLLEVTNLHASSELLKDLKLYSGSSLRLRDLLQEDYPRFAQIGQISHCYRFNTEMFLRALFYMRGDDQDWINSGTLRNDFIFKPEAEAVELPLKAEGAGWEALERIVDICQERKITLRLIASPYLPDYYQAMFNKTEQMQAFRAELPDTIPLYDYMDTVSQNNSFADVLHLNRAGSLDLLKLMIGDGVFEIK